MSTPGSPQPRPGGSHRAASESGASAAAPASPLLLPVLSVLVVLGAIGLAAWMLLTSGESQEQADPTPQVTQPSTQPSDTASSEPTKDEGDGGGDDNNDPDKNNQNDNNDPDKNNQNDNDDENAQAVPQVPVYVFNQTSISGLAAQTASSLESAGWNVVGVDNWVGSVPTDTVYYYPGDRDAAVRLSKDFNDIGRVWPASAPMPAGALTVILADTARK